MEFMHIGVPVLEKGDDFVYSDFMKLHFTNPDDDKFKCEYLKFEEGTIFPEPIQNNVHVAFKVDDLKPYLETCEVIVEPMEVNEHLTCAFVIRNGLVLELMCMK